MTYDDAKLAGTMGRGARKWWYISNSERKGPVSEDDLQRLMIDGALTSSALVWQAGMAHWRPIEEIAALVPLLSELPPEIPAAQQRSTVWHRVRRHLGSS